MSADRTLVPAQSHPYRDNENSAGPRPFLYVLTGVLAVIVAVAVWTGNLPMLGVTSVTSAARISDAPPPGVGEQDRKLALPSAEALTAQGAFDFIERHPDGRAVTYSPCRPIHYVISESFLPPDGMTQVQEAIDVISRHSGFVFVFDGFTDERPRANRPAYQPDRWADRWAPVLIGWVDAGRLDGFRGEEIGEATSTIVYPPEGAAMFVTGQIGLSTETWDEASRGLKRSLLLHELAHLVGLAHVNNDQELLFPFLPDERKPLGEGDKAGLAALHASPCSTSV